MARQKLEIHPEAALELERSYEDYTSRSFVAADAFVHEIDTALEGILESPFLWPKYLERYRRRVLSRFPFSIVYRVVDDVVEVDGASFTTRSDRGTGKHDDLSRGPASEASDWGAIGGGE